MIAVSRALGGIRQCSNMANAGWSYFKGDKAIPYVLRKTFGRTTEILMIEKAAATKAYNLVRRTENNFTEPLVRTLNTSNSIKDLIQFAQEQAIQINSSRMASVI